MAHGSEQPVRALDTQTAYMRDFLRFLGIDDLQFVYAEGLSIGDECKAQALANAEKSIRAIAARPAASLPYVD